MAALKNNNPEQVFMVYEELVSSLKHVERKGKTMPYTSVNGHMFSFISTEGTIGLRLPDEARTEFMKKYNLSLMMQHGSVLKEYVEIPQHLFSKKVVLTKYFKTSYEYISSLKPKATKRK